MFHVTHHCVADQFGLRAGSFKGGQRRSSGAFFVGRAALPGRWPETSHGVAACILDLRSSAGSIVVVEYNIKERAVDM
jgi:hypothetical protein